MRNHSWALLLSLCSLGAEAQLTAVSFRSTDGNYWQMERVATADHVTGQAQVVVRSEQRRQTFKGWGTCFNELDYDAYARLSVNEKKLFVKRVFNPNGDLRLSVGRIPVGASDYARSWYSCDETEGNVEDFDMQHFTIARDRQAIIPSIRLALAENPEMTFWASPWSPPQWMKTNKHYAQRRTSTNGCPFDVPPYFNDQFVDDARYYNAYCLYFDKFIQAYRDEGIDITALAYQNEAYSNTPYPGCSWKATTTGKFLAEYLGPYMAVHQPTVDLIIGTMNTGSLDVYEQILSTPGIGRYCHKIGFQWEGGRQLAEIGARHADYELVQTESECGSGTFDWAAAAHTFQLCNHYLAGGVTTYTYWNAILTDKGLSTWGWQQNSLVQVNSATNQPRYTAEYYAYKHYTHFIPAGSAILYTDETNLVVAARRPDGALVLVMGNDSGQGKTTTVDVDGTAFTAQLPAHSFTTYLLGTDETLQQTMRSEAQGLLDIEKASLTTEQQERLSAALSEGGTAQLVDAVLSVEGKTASAHSELLNPSFTSGIDYWTLDNVMNGGDVRAASIQGRQCLNNWSGNFTSMNVYQELKGLQPGVYIATCLSLCGEGQITDQHLYLETEASIATSPVKTVAKWAADGWERQTTAKLLVREGETLRVGYASTSGGGSNGWFCVTDFVLTRLGESDDEALHDNRSDADQALTAALEAYRKLAAEAQTMAADETYAEAYRAHLSSLLASQAEELEILTEASLVDNLTRALAAAMAELRCHVRELGEGADLSFLIQNPGAENGGAGWQLSLTNGDAVIKSGKGLQGPSDPYFDSYNATAGELWYTGRQTLTGLPNGIYKLVCKACSDGRGAYLFAQSSGEMWKAEATKTTRTDRTGWTDCQLTDIYVKDGCLTIGFSNDMYLTAAERFTGTWMSFDSFRLILVSYVTVGVAPLPDPASRGESADACFDLSGRPVSQPRHGVYVKNRRKMLVR
ncbi:MAG: glycoside hydrolase family 30 protein [Bacteroidaceae bacterium]|nr:glycoside hydrolase family 30 protein [Bacteroidaceae bacterium]